MGERSGEAGRPGVLVRVPNWLGDAVMATCVLRAARAGAPGARITAAGRPKFAELFAGLPWLDEFIPLADGSFLGALALGWSRRGAFDLALVLPNSLRSALMPFAASLSRISSRESVCSTSVCVVRICAR